MIELHFRVSEQGDVASSECLVTACCRTSATQNEKEQAHSTPTLSNRDVELAQIERRERSAQSDVVGNVVIWLRKAGDGVAIVPKNRGTLAGRIPTACVASARRALSNRRICHRNRSQPIHSAAFSRLNSVTVGHSPLRAHIQTWPTRSACAPLRDTLEPVPELMTSVHGSADSSFATSLENACCSDSIPGGRSGQGDSYMEESLLDPARCFVYGYIREPLSGGGAWRASVGRQPVSGFGAGRFPVDTAANYAFAARRQPQLTLHRSATETDRLRLFTDRRAA